MIFFIAVSTFEWYPGVQIHQSKDLKNWRLAARPLNRAALLDMRGNPDSGGVWAPCLSWHDGLFYQTSYDPFLLSLHDDPRWLPLLEEAGASLAQLNAIEFKLNLTE